MEGKKYDKGKSRVDLIHPQFLLMLGHILRHGAEKYDDNNWKKVEGWFDRYYAAPLRHLYQYRMGEFLDKDSGLPHLLHAACSIMFLYAQLLDHPETLLSSFHDLDEEKFQKIIELSS